MSNRGGGVDAAELRTIYRAACADGSVEELAHEDWIVELLMALEPLRAVLRREYEDGRRTETARTAQLG